MVTPGNRRATRVVVYIEGEGGGRSSAERARRDTEFRKNWRTFLKPLVDAASECSASVNIVAGQGGIQCRERFANPLPAGHDALRILIVDSEGPVQDVNRPWRERKWEPPANLSHPDAHCFLMVQSVETWLAADVDAVARHFNGAARCFNSAKIPKWPDLEKVPMRTVQSALESATSDCRRGYSHAAANVIIGSVDRAMVAKLPAGRRLFDAAAALIREWCGP